MPSTAASPRVFDPCSPQYEQHQHGRCAVAYYSQTQQVRVCDCPRHTEAEIRERVAILEARQASKGARRG